MEKENLQDINEEIVSLTNLRDQLKKEVIQLDDEILYQSFGVYTPQYNFAYLDQYKDKLKEIRNKQKKMIAKKKAVIIRTNWKVNGSELLGQRLIAENSKQIIRNFNIECDICIDKVKFNNYEDSKERIFKAYEMQNSLNETNNLEIDYEYYKLKIEELNLAFEFQQKKKEEKEELRIKREMLREEQKVAREIEEKRKQYEKEQLHYENVMKKLKEQIEFEKSEERKQVLLERKNEIENNLSDVDKAMADLDYREANKRAGYVYVISNIGAFGEDIYKIGMTRRLDPEERIAELSGASVPFKFDIHAMIFSDDAPKLETALHHAFEDKKLNLVNGRKEFFRVTLDEIKEVVQKNYDKTVDFVNLPEAEQFRTSEMIRKGKNS
mgnify:CR=1 FL=1